MRNSLTIHRRSLKTADSGPACWFLVSRRAIAPVAACGEVTKPGLARNGSQKQQSPLKRGGFTLLEVLLALTILLFSLAALANLSFVGVKAATRGQLQSEASWHAHTILEEIGAGIRKSVTTRPSQLESGSDWIVSIKSNASDIPGLKYVEVQVWKSGSQPEQSRIKMARMIYDRETQND